MTYLYRKAITLNGHCDTDHVMYMPGRKFPNGVNSTTLRLNGLSAWPKHKIPSKKLGFAVIDVDRACGKRSYRTVVADLKGMSVEQKCGETTIVTGNAFDEGLHTGTQKKFFIVTRQL